MAGERTEVPHLQEWLTLGERGVSSEAIVRWLVYGSVHPGFNAPSDPSDFRRCELLLQWVPMLREQFHRMADLSPRWAALVKHWDELKATLESEIPDVWIRKPRGTAPRTYELMHTIESESK